MNDRPIKLRHRGFRFGLSALLILLLICGLVMLPVAAKLRRYRQQRAAIEALLDRGASISFADGSDKPSDSRWQHVVGDDLFSSVSGVTMPKTGAKDVTPLGEFRRVRTLRINANPIADIRPLAGLQHLQVLDVAGTEVTDFAPLSSLAALQELDLGYTKIADLAPLAELCQLRKLNLWRTPVTDLQPLAELKRLEWIDLHGVAIDDVGPLSKLTALKQVNLAETQVTDLTPMAKLPNVEIYIARGQQVVVPESLQGRVVPLR